MISYYSLGVLLSVALSHAASMAPRSIHRSGRSGDVNLVEFAIRSTIHGRCTYTDKIGRIIKLIYEDSKGKITAKSSNPTVVDAVAAVKECRIAAAELPQLDEQEGRAEEPSAAISPYEIRARFNEFSRSSYENQRYVQQLQPRLLTWVGNTFGLGNLADFGSASNSNQNNFGLSWGNSDNGQNPFPGINLMGPDQNLNQNTITYGNNNPFDFIHQNTGNTGPWGVLNSLNKGNQGGFFGGFPNIFSWLNPFNFFNGNVIR